jgi:hypothetical protein
MPGTRPEQAAIAMENTANAIGTTRETLISPAPFSR